MATNKVSAPKTGRKKSFSPLCAATLAPCKGKSGRIEAARAFALAALLAFGLLFAANESRMAYAETDGAALPSASAALDLGGASSGDGGASPSDGDISGDGDASFGGSASGDGASPSDGASLSAEELSLGLEQQINQVLAARQELKTQGLDAQALKEIPVTNGGEGIFRGADLMIATQIGGTYTVKDYINAFDDPEEIYLMNMRDKGFTLLADLTLEFDPETAIEFDCKETPGLFHVMKGKHLTLTGEEGYLGGLAGGSVPDADIDAYNYMGAIVVRGGGSLNVSSGITIQNCTAGYTPTYWPDVPSGFGGAITLETGSSAVIGGTIDNCKGTKAGAIASIGADLTLTDDASISDCHSVAAIDLVTFETDSSTGHGGGVYSSGGVFDYEGHLDFYSCTSVNSGGGLYVAEQSNGYDFKNLLFYHCGVDGSDGGALSVENCKGALTVESSQFEYCRGNNGGALAFYGNESGETVRNCTFTGCTATNGAAVRWDDAQGHALTVKNCTFTDCKPDGGGIVDVTNAGKSSFTDLEVSLSKVAGVPDPGSDEDEKRIGIVEPQGHGAAFYVRDSEKAVISANISGMYNLGGGVVVENTDLQLSGTITGISTGARNSTMDSSGVQELSQADCGGAVRVVNTYQHTAVLKDVKISHCKAVAGGALYINCQNTPSDDAAVSLQNVEIDSCKSWDCGTVYISSGKVEMSGGHIRNCTRSDGPGHALCLRCGDGIATSPLFTGDNVEISGCTGIGAGTLYVSSQSVLNLNNCTVKENPGNSLGGTLYLDKSGYSSIGGVAHLSNTVVEAGEKCLGSGTCVYSRQGSEFTMNGGRLVATQNDAFREGNLPVVDYGGCIFANGDVRIDGAELVGTVAAAGGVLYANPSSRVYIGMNAPVTIRDGVASNTKLGSMAFCCSGGAICSEASYLHVCNTTFTDCKALNPLETDTPCGGAVCVLSGEASLYNCTMQRCQAGSGGALAMIDGTLRETRNTYGECVAEKAGGALYVTGGSVISSESCAWGNTAQSGAVVCLSPAVSDIDYTFDGYLEGEAERVSKDNAATQSGRDLYLDYSGCFARTVIDGNAEAANAAADTNASDAGNAAAEAANAGDDDAPTIFALNVSATSPKTQGSRDFFVGSDEAALNRAEGAHNIDNTSHLPTYTFYSDTPGLSLVDQDGNSDFVKSSVVVRRNANIFNFFGMLEAVSFAEAGDTIIPLSDQVDIDTLAITDKGSADNPLIIDLNGQKLSSTDKSVLELNNSHVRVVDSSEAKDGAISFSAAQADPEAYAVKVNGSGSLAMESGAIESDAGGVSLEASGSALRMTGGKVSSRDAQAAGIRLTAKDCSVNLAGGQVCASHYAVAAEGVESADITISGDVLLQGETGAECAVHAVQATSGILTAVKSALGLSPAKPTVNMQGGNIVGFDEGFSGVNLTIAGGRVATKTANWGSDCAVEQSISGGRFAFEVEQSALAEGVWCVNDARDAEAPYVVSLVPVVFNSSTVTSYDIPQEAFDDVLAGQTLVMMRDLKNIEAGIVLEGKGSKDNPVILDLNDHIVEGELGGMQSTGDSFILKVDNAALAVMDSSESGSGTVRNTVSARGCAIHLDNEANLFLQSGSIECPGVFPIAGALATAATQLVSVSGGKVVGANTSNWSGCTVRESISGGQFTARVKDAELALGYVCVGFEDAEAGTHYKVQEAHGVQNTATDVIYDDLQTAVDEASAGDSLKLLNTMLLTDSVDIDKSLTLNLCGFALGVAPDAAADGAFKASASHDYLIGVKNGAEFEIEDTSSRQTGKVSDAEMQLACAVKLFAAQLPDESSAGSLFAYSGAIEGATGINAEAGYVSVSGATVKACSSGHAAIVAGNGAYVSIDYESLIDGGIAGYGTSERAEVEVFDGMVTSSSGALFSGVKGRILGGVFAAPVGGSNWAESNFNQGVSGGKFVFPVAEGDLASDYVCGACEDAELGTHYLVREYGEAKNESTGVDYLTLAEAFEDLAAGQTLHLQRDVSNVATLTLANLGTENPVILNLDGHTIEGSVSSGGIIALDSSALTVIDSSAQGAGNTPSEKEGAGSIRNISESSEDEVCTVRLTGGSAFALASGGVECPYAGYPIRGIGNTPYSTVRVEGGRILSCGQGLWDYCSVIHSVSGGYFTEPITQYQLAENFECAVYESDSPNPYRYHVQPTSYVVNVNSGVAFSSLDEALGAAQTEDVLQLIRSFSLDHSVDVNKSITFDLNGNILGVAPDAAAGGVFSDVGAHDYLIGVKSGANLTITDSSASQTGKISDAEGRLTYAVKLLASQESQAASAESLLVVCGTIEGATGVYVQGACVSVQGGTISACAPNLSALAADDGATVNIEGGLVKGNIVVNGGTQNASVSSTVKPVTLEISDGSVQAPEKDKSYALDLAQCSVTMSGGLVSGYYGVGMQGTASFALSGGTVIGNEGSFNGVANDDSSLLPAVEVSGGMISNSHGAMFNRINGRISGGALVSSLTARNWMDSHFTHAVSGGKFTHQVAAEDLAPGFCCVRSADEELATYWLVRETGDVLNASTGVDYLTLQEAFADVKAGQTLRLQRDVEVAQTVPLAGLGTQSPVVLNLEGHTVNGSISSGGIIAVEGSSLKVVDTSANATEGADFDKGGAGAIRNNAFEQAEGVCTIHLADGAAFLLAGGGIECPAAGYPITADADGSASTVCVQGGRILSCGKGLWKDCEVNHSVSGGYFSEEVLAAKLADAYECVFDDSDPQNACPYHVQPMPSVKNLTTGNRYYDLQEALDAVQAGETLQLLNDIAETGQSCSLQSKGSEEHPVILDLHGRTLTFANENTLNFNSSHVVIEDSAEAQAGKIRYFESDPMAAYQGQLVQLEGQSSLVLDSGTISSGYMGVKITGDNAAFTMRGGMLDAPHGQALYIDAANTSINISGGSIVNGSSTDGAIVSGSSASNTHVAIAGNALIDSKRCENFAIRLKPSDTVDMQGGMILAKGDAFFGCKVAVSGGAVVAARNNWHEGCGVEHTVSGGKFVHEITASELAAGYSCLKLEDAEFGTHYVVKKGNLCIENVDTGVAYTEPQAAFDEVLAGQTLKMLADVTLTDNRVIAAEGTEDSPVILDLNGRSMTVSDWKSLRIDAACVLVKDSSEQQTGCIVNPESEHTSPAIRLLNGGTLILESGSIEGYGDECVSLEGGNAKFIMHGGFLTSMGRQAISVAYDSDSSPAIELYGGVVSAKNAASVISGNTPGLTVALGKDAVIDGGGVTSYAISGSWPFAANMQSGVIRGVKAGFQGLIVTVSGGSIAASNANWETCTVNHSVSGGRFAHEINASELASGYGCFAFADAQAQTSWEVKALGDVLNLATNQIYENLQDGIDEAAAGDTLRVLRDISLDGSIAVKPGVTLDVAGKTINLASMQVFGKITDSSETLVDGVYMLPQGGLTVDRSISHALLLPLVDMGEEGQTVSLPAWDGNAQCYRFYTVSALVPQFKDVSGTGLDFKFRFQPQAEGGKEAWDKILASDSGVSLRMHVEVKRGSAALESGGEADGVQVAVVPYDFDFGNPDLVGQWLRKPLNSFFVLSGTLGADVESLACTPQIYFDGACIAYGTTLEQSAAASEEA